MNVEKNIALTPLCLAAMLKHEEVVSLLVGYGATINVTNEVRSLTYICFRLR